MAAEYIFGVDLGGTTVKLGLLMHLLLKLMKNENKLT